MQLPFQVVSHATVKWVVGWGRSEQTNLHVPPNCR